MNDGGFKKVLIFLSFFWVFGIDPVGFGEDSLPSLERKGQEHIQRFEVHLESYIFLPSRLQVQIDIPVEMTLMNDSFLVPHNFVLENSEKKVYLEQQVDAGEQAVIQFTLTQPGVYSFYCDNQFLFFPSHREEGMVGTIEAL
ncbi:MAG: cupredoxin domain-containing protein [Nitrospirae bacterium]|nr:cupredoxin domain-containing protein [Nitrospirota bacterium]